MAVNHVVTRGFGNGSLIGTIALAVTRGYSIGAITDNLIDNNDTATAASLLNNTDSGSGATLIDNTDTPTAANLVDVT